MRALWSNRQNCSHNVSQNLKRISRLSEHYKGHQHTDGNFTETLNNMEDLRQNTGEFEEGSGEYGISGSPNFI